MSDDSPRDEVRALFLRERAAVLCTAHAGRDGWPYGSVVPYAVLPGGDLVLFLSTIAEHTHNLLRDPRATVLVADPEAHDEPQRGARHAMMVRARRPVDEELAVAEACYFARFPDAEAMRGAHGFDVWLLECERIRWILGFGAMGWLDRSAWQAAGDPLATHRDGIVRHLNDDHADALALLARHLGAVDAATATAVGLDSAGIDLRAVDARGREHAVRLPFAEPATSPDAVRRVVVAMVQQARAARR